MSQSGRTVKRRHCSCQGRPVWKPGSGKRPVWRCGRTMHAPRGFNYSTNPNRSLGEVTCLARCPSPWRQDHGAPPTFRQPTLRCRHPQALQTAPPTYRKPSSALWSDDPATLSRWRHGFESRWGCQKSPAQRPAVVRRRDHRPVPPLSPTDAEKRITIALDSDGDPPSTGAHKERVGDTRSRRAHRGENVAAGSRLDRRCWRLPRRRGAATSGPPCVETHVAQSSHSAVLERGRVLPRLGIGADERCWSSAWPSARVG